MAFISSLLETSVSTSGGTTGSLPCRWKKQRPRRLREQAEAPGAGREALVRADGRGEFEACPELMT